MAATEQTGMDGKPNFHSQLEATCIGCGCTDSHACEGGCWWLRLDRHLRAGVCSQCESALERWRLGERKPKAGAS